MSEEGFWVRYWYGRGQSSLCKETFRFYPFKSGWTEEDKDKESMWEQEADSWARDEGCWSARSYSYGFEFVDKPPKDWLESKADYHQKMANFYNNFLEDE